jgi:hypothetical protein
MSFMWGSSACLVSLPHYTAFRFEVTQPRDTIYALLAVSRGTRARSLERFDTDEKAGFGVDRPFKSQPYYVDYKPPIIDFYKGFVEF